MKFKITVSEISPLSNIPKPNVTYQKRMRLVASLLFNDAATAKITQCPLQMNE
jgi:hypothetical protein